MKPVTKTEIARALEQPAFQPKLPAKMIERFDPRQLPMLLEREIRCCEEANLSHVMMNMTLDDAASLASFLRRAALLGV